MSRERQPDSVQRSIAEVSDQHMIIMRTIKGKPWQQRPHTARPPPAVQTRSTPSLTPQLLSHNQTPCSFCRVDPEQKKVVKNSCPNIRSALRLHLWGGTALGCDVDVNLQSGAEWREESCNGEGVQRGQRWRQRFRHNKEESELFMKESIDLGSLHRCF